MTDGEMKMGQLNILTPFNSRGVTLYRFVCKANGMHMLRFTI